MAEIRIRDSDPASVHVGNASLEQLDRSRPSHRNRDESTAI